MQGPVFQQPMYAQPMYAQQQPMYAQQQQPIINVNVQQQQSGSGGGTGGVQRHTGEWKNGLCSCLESCSDCCCACFCPACFAIYSSDKVNDSTASLCGILTCLTLLAGLGGLPYCVVRGKAREAHNIEGSSIEDLFTTCCCLYCVMIQVKREFDLD